MENDCVAPFVVVVTTFKLSLGNTTYTLFYIYTLSTYSLTGVCLVTTLGIPRGINMVLSQQLSLLVPPGSLLQGICFTLERAYALQGGGWSLMINGVLFYYYTLCTDAYAFTIHLSMKSVVYIHSCRPVDEQLELGAPAVNTCDPSFSIPPQEGTVSAAQVMEAYRKHRNDQQQI